MTQMPKSSGRPPIGPQKPIRLYREQWDRIDRLAALHRLDRSAMVRKLIADYFALVDSRPAVSRTPEETQS